MAASDGRPRCYAYTLIEMMMVIVIVGIIAATAIPSFQPNVYGQLQAAARLIGDDVSYARNLAVVYNSKYRIDFDLTQNQYVLRHSGSNTALNTLPKSPSQNSSDPADRQITRLEEALSSGVIVRVYAVYSLSTPAQSIGDIELGPLGETTRPDETIVWLGAGSGSDARYLSVRISPVTGLYRIGTLQGTAPTLATPAN